jgi:heat shock protein HslJ
MKSKIIFLISFAIILSACDLFQNKSKNQEWVGIYRGVMPCADCAGIKTQLELRANNEYILTQKYMGKNDTIFKHKEDFEWNKNSKIISLNNYINPSLNNKYIYENNSLKLLDSEGNKIQSEFEDLYSLNRIEEDSSFKNKYWKLIELNGKEFTKRQKYRIPAHIIFNENSIVGNASCNQINGTFEIDENNKIEISEIASTKMHCEFMEIETQFINFLQNTDSLELITDTLILHTNDKEKAKFKYLYFK